VTCIDKIIDESYENELHVHSWTLERLKPSNSLKVKNIMLDPYEETENNIDDERISNDVCVGDNVAVIISSDNDEQFWLLS
jgi:hypothetical protein